MLDVFIVTQHDLYHIDDCSPEWHEDEEVHEDVEEVVDEEVVKEMGKMLGEGVDRVVEAIQLWVDKVSYCVMLF